MTDVLPMWHNFKVILGAFPVSVLVTGAAIWVCHRKNWLVQPREDRWSRTPVAKYGGIGILLVFFVSTVGLHIGNLLRMVAVLTLAMALVGFLDDTYGLRVRWKLLSEVAIAVTAVASGVLYPLFPSHLANIVFSILWLVAVTNAFNLLDNMDGLCAGVSIIACVNLLVLIRNANFLPLSVLLLMLEGCLLGFLLFNFYPAKIFMGDTGSLAIGFFLGCAGIIGAAHLSSIFSILFVPGLVLFLPLFDMLLVSVTRRLNGRAISAGAKDHTSHRLVLLGMSERKAVITLYLISALSGAVALVCKRFWSDVGPGILALFLLTAALFWLYVADIRLPENWLSRTNVFTLALPEVLNSISRRAAMVFSDAALIVLSQFLAFLLRFDGTPHQYWRSLLWGSVLLVTIKVPLLALFQVYRRDWTIRSVQDIYPILKGSILGSVAVVALLTYATQFRDYSRGVFGIETVLTIVLLAAVRVARNMFDDALTGNSDDRCLVVGGSSAEFFYRYFEWQKAQAKITAFVNPVKKGNGTAFLFGIPVVPLSHMPNQLKNPAVKAVYILPDCPESERAHVAKLCGSAEIPLHLFRLSLEKVGSEAESEHAARLGMSETA